MRRRMFVAAAVVALIVGGSLYYAADEPQPAPATLDDVTAAADCPRQAGAVVEDGVLLQLGGASDGVELSRTVAPHRKGYVAVNFVFTTPERPFGWWVSGEEGAPNWHLAGPSDNGRIISNKGIFTFYVLYDDPTMCNPIVNALLADFDPDELKQHGHWPR